MLPRHAIAFRPLITTHLTTSVVSYCFDNWEESVDAVRHNARNIFENIIASYIAAVNDEGRVILDSPPYSIPLVVFMTT